MVSASPLDLLSPTPATRPILPEKTTPPIKANHPFQKVVAPKSKATQKEPALTPPAGKQAPHTAKEIHKPTSPQDIKGTKLNAATHQPSQSVMQDGKAEDLEITQAAEARQDVSLFGPALQAATQILEVRFAAESDTNAAHNLQDYPALLADAPVLSLDLTQHEAPLEIRAHPVESPKTTPEADVSLLPSLPTEAASSSTGSDRDTSSATSSASASASANASSTPKTSANESAQPLDLNPSVKALATDEQSLVDSSDTEHRKAMAGEAAVTGKTSQQAGPMEAKAASFTLPADAALLAATPIVQIALNTNAPTFGKPGPLESPFTRPSAALQETLETMAPGGISSFPLRAQINGPSRQDAQDEFSPQTAEESADPASEDFFDTFLEDPLSDEPVTKMTRQDSPQGEKSTPFSLNESVANSPSDPSQGPLAGDQSPAMNEALMTHVADQKTPGGQAFTLQSTNKTFQGAAAQGTVYVPPAEQIAVSIKNTFSQGTPGKTQIDLQLRPDNLGRVNIKLDINQEGQTIVVVATERQETRDLLLKDNAQLMEILKDAGMEIHGDDVSYNLLEQGDTSEQSPDHTPSRLVGPTGDADEPSVGLQASLVALQETLAPRHGGLFDART